MFVIILIFGIVIASFSVYGIVSPSGLMGLVTSSTRDKRGFWFAVGIRLVLGAAFIIAAPQSRFPIIIQAIGVIAIIAAVVILIMGYDRLRAFVDWWRARSTGVVRAWCLLAALFGVFLVYAGLP